VTDILNTLPLDEIQPGQRVILVESGPARVLSVDAPEGQPKTRLVGASSR
jgi:hypothetical protein